MTTLHIQQVINKITDKEMSSKMQIWVQLNITWHGFEEACHSLESAQWWPYLSYSPLRCFWLDHPSPREGLWTVSKSLQIIRLIRGIKKFPFSQKARKVIMMVKIHPYTNLVPNKGFLNGLCHYWEQNRIRLWPEFPGKSEYTWNNFQFVYCVPETLSMLSQGCSTLDALQ